MLESSRSAMVLATLMVLKYERAERLSFSEALFKSSLALGSSLISSETLKDERELL